MTEVITPAARVAAAIGHQRLAAPSGLAQSRGLGGRAGRVGHLGSTVDGDVTGGAPVDRPTLRAGPGLGPPGQSPDPREEADGGQQDEGLCHPPSLRAPSQSPDIVMKSRE